MEFSQSWEHALKKSLCASEQDRPDVAARRQAWPEHMYALDPAHLVFLDESGAKTNMTPLYGRRFDGERLVDHAPHGRWQTTSVIGALRLEGVSACMTLEGPVDGTAFAAYVKQFLCPMLRQGDIVILDNLSSHR